jgi:AbrB family looped-hinge helix DNA binding protein
MIQKVLKVGSSAAVTIPKKALKELGLKPGDSVSLSIDAGRVVIQPDIAVDAETVAWARKFIERYRPALNALADK